MGLRHHCIALSIATVVTAPSPIRAAPAAIDWVRYSVPETGAAVDIPLAAAS